MPDKNLDHLLTMRFLSSMGNLIFLIQGSTEWHEWRKKGIGASDTPAVMGVSPWSTPHRVWLEKTGRKKSFEGNFVTNKGSEKESKARALYELVSLENMQDACGTHPKYDFIRASFDGVTNDGKKILEIKVPSEEVRVDAAEGKIPIYYKIQIQQQLLVSGADQCDFFTYNPKTDSYEIVEVKPDLKMQAEIIVALETFWNNHVLKDIPPALTDKDAKKVNDNAEVKELCQNIKAFRDTATKDEMDSWKAKIVKLGGHSKIKCGDVQISTVLRNGVFSYHKLTISKSPSV